MEAANPATKPKDVAREAALLLLAELLVLVASTAITEPMVALGTTVLLDAALAVAERAAKPTEGGLNLKTE